MENEKAIAEIRLLSQDDAAPDALECFKEEFKNITDVDMKEFKDIGCLENIEDFTLRWHYSVFTLEISADDPYHKLYVRIKT